MEEQHMSERVEQVFSLFGADRDELMGWCFQEKEEHTVCSCRERYGEITLCLAAKAADRETAEQELQRLTEKLRRRFDGQIYSNAGQSLQQAVVEELKRRGWKIATAESLTGGWVSKRITEVPGASLVLECGVCSYSNRIKHEVLGVRQQTLDVYTEYSSQTAAEMAEGVRRLAGADIGVSTTGIAGPGGVGDKPAGLVYVGVSTKNDTRTCELHLAPSGGEDRGMVRGLAASYALFMVWKELLGH